MTVISAIRKPVFPSTAPVTLSLGARARIRTVQSALVRESMLRNLQIARGSAPTTTVTNGVKGPTGPNGEPLVQVKLPNGRGAYVDPNTNQYYLTAEKQGLNNPLRCFPDLGGIQVHGPFPLPAGAQMPNEHYSVADVRALQQIVNTPTRFPAPFPGGQDIPLWFRGARDGFATR